MKDYDKSWYKEQERKELNRWTTEKTFMAIQSWDREQYQDLEDEYMESLMLGSREELVDKLIFLAHEIGNDLKFGGEVRKELLKWDERK